MSKLVDILNKHLEDERRTGPLFSFEYFPPKTDKGVENLYERLDRMKLMGPSWIDVTWGAGGSTSALTQEICHTAQNFIGLETMMHMTCTNLPKDNIRQALIKARESGIRNILALRGDPPRGEEWKQIDGGFGHAVDLVKFIRQEHGNYFGICVAGYPEGHIDAVNYEEDLQHLKAKVDAGADMIITQLFYDVDLFFKFVKDCRALGINVPIIPGIMPIHGYAGFIRMTTLCKTFVPKQILDDLEPIKNDDEAVKEYGVKLAIQMCKRLLENGVPALHFYTLNLEKSVARTLEGLGLIEENIQRPLPWQMAVRGKETVRPIFWSNRPRSYIHRTSTWDEFPNGRWGDSRSPAFGDLTDYHLASLHNYRSFDRKTAWGANLTSEQDVYNVFSRYCTGEIEKLPWWDTPLAPESEEIKGTLARVNKHGFLTINSQPKVNGARSTDARYGWGPAGGYVYQKAYIEFFTSPENLKALIEVIKEFPSVSYHAVNSKGQEFSNTKASVNAVTWGVFPGREIVQPTVVDHTSFMVWKDEAFTLWQSQWACVYEPASPSRKIIESIFDTYFLVNMVDEDYVHGDLFAVFDKIILKKSN